MKKEKLKELKELLSIPSSTWEEDMVISHLLEICDDKGYHYDVDDMGNVYITKGSSDNYPLVLAHTDTVHSLCEMYVNEEPQPNAQGDMKLSLKAYRKDNGLPTGIGGDDKAGIFICLQLLERFDNIKAFFPVAEEIGCKGSLKADEEFFQDVGYAIQFDSTENDTMSLSLMGTQLFEYESDFFKKSKGIILEHGITEWKHHPYTDAMVLSQKFSFACFNFAAGYYKYHTSEEYVVVEDVVNSTNLGESLIKELGEEHYQYKPQSNSKYSWF